MLSSRAALHRRLGLAREARALHIDHRAASPVAGADMRLPAKRRAASGRLGVTGLVDRDASAQLLSRAVDALRLKRPEFSASGPMWRWQRIAFATLGGALTVGAASAPRPTLAALFALLALPFFCVVLLRALALCHAGAKQSRVLAGGPVPRRSDEEMPHYSIVVPLYREAVVLPQLLGALSAIDYPASKLEILFVVESVDEETQAALQGMRLAPTMRTIVVPDGEPRTKPRALNFALEHARGDYVVVYDAEDVPEPDQLRRALSRLTSDRRIGCVQARLNIYNADETWLTRQFTIEYTALFNCLLPTLERLRLPVPLGGTSNHFPRAVLDEVGAWDPFNVTEDADLGIRLARAGWRVEVLASTTWEEAPQGFGVWLRQRTRWLKGWMQTYLVHMRQPARLARELGTWRFLGLQVLMGGLILSALVHPWFYVLALLDAAHGLFPVVPQTVSGQALWWVGLFNLVTGYATGVALGSVAVAACGRRRLAAHTALMPLYWLLISFAAYRAVGQLMAAPHLWEKTEHMARARGGGAGFDFAAAEVARPLESPAPLAASAVGFLSRTG
jgi:glycosyltransferase involved in cell wall biosynthesis